MHDLRLRVSLYLFVLGISPFLADFAPLAINECRIHHTVISISTLP